MKLSTAASTFRERLVDELTEEMDLELPDALVEAEMESNLHTLAHRLGEQGIDLANYLRITGQDQEAFTAELRGGATRSLRARVLLEAIAEAESIEVGDEDIAEAVATLAAQAGRPTEDIVTALSEGGQGAALSGDILRGKAMDRLLEAVTPVDADGNTVDLTPPVADPGDEEPESEETTPQAGAEPHNVEESDVAAEVSNDDAATKAEEHE
jgi:trigger factor